MKTYKVIGLMSGTSLDGLDLAYCEFKLEKESYSFEILQAETVEYSENWKEKLQFAHHQNARDFAELNAQYGIFTGEEVSKFISKYNLEVDFLASHGHTVFHEPQKNFTTQIGSGAHIASVVGIKTICDFRTTDVALGGHGAPLVPIGDRLLFGDYEYCLNLGGIANISSEKEGIRSAFDICPVNLVLNYLAQQLGKPYDKGGDFAAQGKFNEALFDTLNADEFYTTTGPKSLGREWIESDVLPILLKSELSTEDKLHTFCCHIAFQIAGCLNRGRILITGGGTYNTFLLDCFAKYFPEEIEIVIPEAQIIEFKEALIFVFLGVLRIEEKINTLSTVSGASKDSVGGCVYLA